jgi:hypothetical protein
MSITIAQPSVLESFAREQRNRKFEQLQYALIARTSLDQLCEVMRHGTGQSLKVRNFLFSLWNGKPARLIDVLDLDWSIRKSLCAIILAFGFEDQTTRTFFFYKQMEAIIRNHRLWDFFLQGGGEETGSSVEGRAEESTVSGDSAEAAVADKGERHSAEHSLGFP